MGVLDIKLGSLLFSLSELDYYIQKEGLPANDDAYINMVKVETKNYFEEFKYLIKDY